MMQQVKLKKIFSLFGPPGSGKGTLAQRLLQEKPCKILSTGNACRDHIAQKTHLGTMLNDYLKQGLLIPDSLINDIVIDWLKNHHIKNDEFIILDGFPRTVGQAAYFFSFLKKNMPNLDFHITVIELNYNEVINRLAKRLLCSNRNCQAPYSKTDTIDYCLLCNSKLITRDDDQETVVRQRLIAYDEYKDTLLNFYKHEKLPIHILHVDGLEAESVFQMFCALL